MIPCGVTLSANKVIPQLSLISGLKRVLETLSEAEKEELYSLARKEPQAQYDFKTEIEKLWVAVRALQNGNVPEEETDTVKEWVQPTGAHDAYMAGDIVKYTDGKTYKSLIDNNVWSPDTYPAGWEVI